MTAGVSSDRTLRGIAFALLSYLLFACMDAIAKWLGEIGYSVVQLIFFRALFGFLPVIPVVRADGGWAALRTRRPGLHLIRAAAVVLALASFFMGLRFMPLAEALTLVFTGPLFLTLLAIPLLGERVGPHRLGAVAVGFAGVIVAMRPGAEAFRVEALYLLFSGLTFALTSVLTRLLGRSETNGAILFYSTLGQFVPTALLLPWSWMMPLGTTDWLLFLALGLVGGCAMQCMTLGFRYAPASLIAPFEYSALLWGTLSGWLIWREFPDPAVWAGAALLVSSGLYIAWREARLSRRQRGGG